MALDMKLTCQTCEAPTPENGVAYICSYECTFCADCAQASPACPKCGGELLPRPRRGSLEDAPSMTAQRLGAFNEAWLRADVAALMELVTHDCVYGASVGPEPGTTYAGRSEVERGFREILAYEDGGESRGGPVWLYGDRGISQWSYTKEVPGGGVVEVRGCDLFEFAGDRIRRKDAFVKTLPLTARPLERPSK